MNGCRSSAHDERIHVSFRPHLTAYRGKLLSKSPKGDAVYAGSFLRKRKIVLDEQMLRTPRVLERIFVHEVFHFVWSKLGVGLRSSYEQLVMEEIENGVLGELGWSAESMKLQLTQIRLRRPHPPLERLYLRELLRFGRMAFRHRPPVL